MKILNRTTYLILLCLLAIACGKQEADRRHSDNIIRIKMDAESTKASVLTTDGFKTKPGKFIMEAYVDRDVFNDEAGQHAHTRVGNAYFGPTDKHPENVAYDSANESWDLTRLDNKDVKQPCYWVSSDGNMSFWSWVKLNNTFTIDKDKSALYLTSPNVDKTKGVKMVFDYSLPTPTLETTPKASSLEDATNQEDLVFSYWQAALTNTTPEAEKPTYEYSDVPVHFYHALSQIRFCFSNNDNTFENNIKIKSIAISDVASGGTCTFWGKIGMDEFIKFEKRASDKGRNVASIFSWNDLKTDKTYRQDYDVTVDSSTTEYSGWEKGSYSKDSNTYNLFTCQNVFMMIPQVLDGKAKKASVRLTIVDSSKPENQQEQEFISYISDTWEAGKYYTYKLNYKSGQISFSVKLEKWGIIDGDQPREYTID